MVNKNTALLSIQVIVFEIQILQLDTCTNLSLNHLETKYVKIDYKNIINKEKWCKN